MSLTDSLAHPVAWSGIPSLIRRFFFKHAVTILVYHDPSIECFESHVKWLVKRYNIVSIDEVIEALGKNDIMLLGDYPLLITIDDGRKGNYHLLSVIKQHSIRPCCYLCSSVVGTRRQLWDDFIVDHAPHELKKLKAMTESERRKYLSVHFGMKYEIEEVERSMLSIEEINKMKTHVDFASHGCFHQPFSALTEKEMCHEAVVSKQEIERLTGEPCGHFSFPSGMYDDRCDRVLKDAGYISVRTIDYGGNSHNNDIFSLRVCGVSDDADLSKLNVQSSGVFGFLRKKLLP